MKVQHNAPANNQQAPSSASRRSHDGKKQVQLKIDFENSAALPPITPPLPALTVALPTKEVAVESACTRLAQRVAKRLETDPNTKFDNRELSKWTREIFGSSAGHARDAYDAAEAGFNLFLTRSGINFYDLYDSINGLLAAQTRLPTQTKRDHRQVELQQFSTPPAEALVLVAAAALKSGMSVLEPSAGTGNIAVIARLAGAAVDTNEIDPRRRELLELQGFRPKSLDAERLNNLLPLDCRYDAIVMNPPFSATGGRVQGHNTTFGSRHIEQALLRLKPGGRLAAIVGQGMAWDRPGFSDWWSNIAGRYNVRANIGLDGKQYEKYGTTFDNQIIVIDHDGPTAKLSSVITAKGLSVHQAYEALQAISTEDVLHRIQTLHKKDSPKSSDKPTQQIFFSKVAQEPRNGSHNNVTENHFANILQAVQEKGQQNLLHANGTKESPPAPEIKLANGASVGELDQSPPTNPVDIEEGTVFAAYRVQKAVVHGSVPHPANIVESTAMACVESPDVTYQHHLPQEVIAEGRISDLQLEDVIYSGQAATLLLPDGSRKGHWNGDGTGTGKGRQIYASIFDQFMQGQTKHVHISASHQLCQDAQRDRDALGLPLPILHQAKFKTAEPIGDLAGVFYSTYTMLATDFNGKRQRFKQLIEWLGDDFEGIIAFDEAHLMKNAAATPHGGKATVDQGTQRGNMGIELQRIFPKARVRYFSATGATEARHMAPYERLGLWGAGAPFADFPSFLVAMERGGVAAMEMLCRDLKSVGTYLSRTISYGPTKNPDGTTVADSAVEYEPLLHNLTTAEKEQYDQISDFWSELLTAFESAESNSGETRNGHRYSQFYSAQQRFFLQLMMAYTVPDLIPAIESDLNNSRSVVVSLFNTGEAQTNRKVKHARANGIEISELDATPREMIVQLIETRFPIYQYQEKTDPKTGNVVRVRVEDEFGTPEINVENQLRQEELLERVADLDFPQNPLDALISHFGVENVAEISGRTNRFENGKYVRRKLKGIARRELNAYETKLFQDGTKRIALLSGAGSTGISTHADRLAKNQQRRVFYAFQLSWSADQQMQAFGRVHRANQVSAPIIRLALIDLAGQRRLVNAVSKRLAALGALTKGERQSLSSDLFRPEDVTDEFGRAALTKLYREIEMGKHTQDGLNFATLKRMGLLDKEGAQVRDSYLGNVELFLNRIMVLHVQDQNRIFDLFYERYTEAVDAAKQQGAFDFGVEEIRAKNLSRMSEPEVVFEDPASGARTLLHELQGEVDVVRTNFVTASRRAKLGFFQNRRSGRIYGVSEHPDLDRNDYQLTAVKGPRRSLEAHELDTKFVQVDPGDAQTWWDAAYANTPATELQSFHLLSGALIPIYDKVMGASGVQNVKISRALLHDGQSLVGLHLSAEDVPLVKQRLGIGTPLAEASAQEILDLVAAGSLIELDNGWRLRKSRLSGDQVLELNLYGLAANRDELLGYGLLEERINFKRRWFVLLEDSLPMLTKLLAHRKAIKDLAAASRESDMAQRMI